MDLLVSDFEDVDYGGWKVVGEAFGQRPAHGKLPNQMPVSGFVGGPGQQLQRRGRRVPAR